MVPLTDLVKTTGNIKNSNKIITWSEKHQHAFDTIKKIVSREVLLAYPRFDQPFVIHTDASDYQLGSVISQNNMHIAFFSRKLNNAQRRYTTMEQELLCVVETLKEYRNILFGHEVIVYMDHKNLVHETLLMSSDRVMQW